jgi:hypothetical protein
LLVGGIFLAGPGSARTSPVGSAPLSGVVAAPSPSSGPTVSASNGSIGSATPVPLPGAALPTQLAIAGRSVAIAPVGAHGQELDLPDAPDMVGWWSSGAVPAQQAGSVLIAGHIDSARWGIGILSLLTTLQPGSVIAIKDTDDRTWSYRMIARRAYAKNALPADLFTTNGSARLVLLTCGGRFDRIRQQYDRNLVVYASPV